MSEKINFNPKDTKFKYPDNKVPRDYNCFLYTFYKLGLDINEARGLNTPLIEQVFFSVVNSATDANAIGIKFKPQGNYVHMVYVDQATGKWFDKTNSGQPIKQTSLTDLQTKYPDEKFSVIYLKVNPAYVMPDTSEQLGENSEIKSSKTSLRMLFARLRDQIFSSLEKPQ